jgi:hypothetical protein
MGGMFSMPQTAISRTLSIPPQARGRCPTQAQWCLTPPVRAADRRVRSRC